jgi:hypothetical protein
MPEAGTVESAEGDRHEGGRATTVALSGFTMLALLTAIALGMSLLRGDSMPTDTADPSPGLSASDSADPVPSIVPTKPSGSPAKPSGSPTRPGSVSAKPWRLLRVGDPVTVTTDFTDPGGNDTFTCDIDWDDGTKTSEPAPDHVCQGTHAYPRAGMYTIKSVVTDDDGGTLRVPGVLVIVYGPAAGRAQGNGWLKPDHDGGFDFTASYPPGSAAGPDGAVTFALPSQMNLDLRNHQHLEWLVVTPDGKIAIKGTAEGASGHDVGFVLYGYRGCPSGRTDGCQPGPHRLRMVVWDSTANGPIPEGVPALYDNRPGSSFDIDQANPQTIDHGVILISSAGS